MKICAVIPAAGKGSRLNSSLPKILIPLSSQISTWNILKSKLQDLVDHIVIIIASKFLELFELVLAQDLAMGFVSLHIQDEPRGMGEAIFCAHRIWACAEKLLVIWGDQVLVSKDTITKAIHNHNGDKKIILPLVKILNPYVEYIFANKKLQKVQQAREDEVCSLEGWSDVGVFLLSVKNLYENWLEYLPKQMLGKRTQEINFLPFLPFLSTQGWDIIPIKIKNSLEARGLNTREDLEFFRAFYKEISL